MFSYTSRMFIILLLFLCASTVIGQASSNHVRCNEKDQRALSVLRQGIEDPSKLLSSWSTEEDCCNWVGVECDNITGRVTKLDLLCSDHISDGTGCLGGKIDFSFSELEFLTYLDLGSNDFKAIRFVHGPRSPTNFSNLVHLDLSYNYNLLMDNLRWVSHFPSLEYLFLDSVTINHETLWLQQMTMLPSLVELSLSNCSLTGTGVNPSPLEFINSTSSSSSLAFLDLSDNYLDDLEVLKWLPNLSSSVSWMDLSSNHLRGPIAESEIMTRFQYLETLFLSSNYLNGSIPEWIGQCKHLDHLDLSNNSFSGPIPASFGNLSSLTYLDVSNNQLNGSLPREIWELSTLEALLVGYNSLSGNLSEQTFTKLSNLKLLHMDASAFTFQFGANWQPPFQLEEFRAPNSKLGPEFPSWLYTQTTLSYLDLSSSGLSFHANEEFWIFLSQVVSFNLYNNSISGEIPNLLVNNVAINLRANNLTGELPPLSPRVYVFIVADNNLSGPISPSLCYNPNMTGESRLMHLDLSNNQFSGYFPDCWMLWKSLNHLSLGGNNLTGKIPDSIGSLTELQTLRLHNNNLSGNMPALRKSFAQLWFLDLGFNEFTGNIPGWISQLSLILLLRSNKFNGSIPSHVCQLSDLLVLDLANNMFSGPIPKCLYNITKMVTDIVDPDLSVPRFNKEYASYLPETYNEDLNLLVKGHQLGYKKNILLLRIVDLSSNDLSGLIPPELFSLVTLQSLNLSHNRLEGVVPSEIGHMKFLESLDFSSNLFSGEIPQSMSNLSFLNHLNLSYNNFKGMIPLGTQLQSFDAFSFIGNPELCGAPLPKNCTQGENDNGSKWKEDEDNDFRSSFYIGMGVGFAFSFWGICGSIFFVRRWKHAYFRMLDKLFVFVAVKMNNFH